MNRLDWFIIVFGIVLFLVFFMVVAVCSVSAADIYVDDDGGRDHTNIQDAINASSNGDNIYVWNGTYNEKVVVNKSVNIIGNHSDTTFVNGEGSAPNGIFRVTVDWVNVSNLCFYNAQTTNHMGMYIQANHTNISSCIFALVDIGLEYYTTDSFVCDADLMIHNNTFYYGVDEAYGLHILYASNVSIIDNLFDNTVYDNDYPDNVLVCEVAIGTYHSFNITGNYFVDTVSLEIQGVDNSKIYNNTFVNTTLMLAYGDWYRNTSIYDNYFTGSSRLYIQDGIYDNITIYNNSFVNITGTFGLTISTNYQVTDVLIYNNTFYNENVTLTSGWNWMVELTGDPGNGSKFYNNTMIAINTNGIGIDVDDFTGIHIDEMHNLEVYNNIIYGYRVGVYFWSNTENATLRNNRIYSNTWGFYLNNSGATNNVINDSFIQNNDYGISLDSGTSGNIIYNNFFNNTNNVLDAGTNFWNISKTLGTNLIGGAYLGGNYWYDYEGSDTDGDGLGDTLTPYNSSGGISSGGDYHPLVIIYPDPPYNATVLYHGPNASLNFSWTRGNYSDREIVVNCTDYWAYSPYMCNEDYNDTTQYFNQSPLVHFYYYTVWSYNSSYNVYSLTPLEIHWGAMKIETWDENITTLDCYNYTIFITDRPGSDTYINNNSNNPTYISLQDVPYGDDTVFLISNEYYRSRTYYYDLALNNFYDFDFFLPPLAIGVEEGAGDDGGNTSATKLYQLMVVGPQGEFTSEPIEDVKMTIRRYIPANDSYMPITILYTDANGQCEVYLIPDNVYKVTLEKDGYITKTSDYIPSASVFTHTFRILPEFDTPTEYDPFSLDVSGTMVEANNSMYITYSDANSSTTNWTIQLYSIYNGVWTLNYTVIGTSDTYTYYATNINLTRKHILVLYYNNTANFMPSLSSPLYYDIFPIHIWHVNASGYVPDKFDIEDRIGGVFGEFDLGWANLISVILAVMILVSLGPYNVAAALIGSGISLGFMSLLFGIYLTNTFPPLLLMLCPVLIFLGIIYFFTKGTGEVAL